MSQENNASSVAPVIVAGAGPTGLTLAAELRRGGAKVLLLERRDHRGQDGSRAAGMQPRTIEMLDQRGIVDPFLAAGPQTQLGNFAGIMLDYGGLATRFPYTLNIMQIETESLLERYAEELGVPVQWSTEVTGFHQDADGVEVNVSGPAGTKVLRGSYLVACDGGRSAIRKQSGVGFPGTDATNSYLIGDVELDDPPQQPLFLDRREQGTITAIQFRAPSYRIATSEPQPKADSKDPVTFDELRASEVRVAGTDFGMHSPTWLSKFNDAVRQVEHYRLGRVLLAGDAAHIHLPAGGQGMNLGMQNAFNLGWKLAAVLRGDAPEQLLDTYHEERHTVDSDTFDLIRAQAALFKIDPTTNELYKILRHLVGFDDVNSYLSAVLSGLDVHYPMGNGEHPLTGRRVPDAPIELATTNRRARIHELLRPARPVLLDLAGDTKPLDALAGWSQRLQVVAARGELDQWEIPNIGTVPAPAAILIRPDGYIAWATNGRPDPTALQNALTTWCGPAKVKP